MKKRVLAFLLATVFVLTLVMSVSAEGVQCDLSGTKNCTLTVKGTTAHCHSSLTDSSGTIKSVKVEQSLEKFAFLWFWNTEGGPWTRTVNSGVAQFDNYKVVSSGTYRVKSVFTVTTKDGKSETITMYSNEVKVAQKHPLYRSSGKEGFSVPFFLTLRGNCDILSL